jgi:hypothetical protein
MTRAKGKRQGKLRREKTGRTAIISLYGDETGTLCQAYDVVNGVLQPDELPDVEVAKAWMDIDLDSTVAEENADEKQCVRSVLGILAKKGYTRAVFWEGSELQPDWMEKFLEGWKPGSESSEPESLKSLAALLGQKGDQT